MKNMLWMVDAIAAETDLPLRTRSVGPTHSASSGHQSPPTGEVNIFLWVLASSVQGYQLGTLIRM